MDDKHDIKFSEAFVEEVMGIFYYSSLISITFIDEFYEMKTLLLEQDIFEIKNILDLYEDLNEINRIISQTQAPKEIIHFFSASELNYIALGLWDKERLNGVIIAGPFTDKPYSSIEYNRIIDNLKIPLESMPALKTFYKKLPIVTRPRINFLAKFLVKLITASMISTKYTYRFINATKDR